MDFVISAAKQDPDYHGFSWLANYSTVQVLNCRVEAFGIIMVACHEELRY